ncbi:MAG TPA: Rne/Rng family ribonuclease [Bacteriovoracaceae bacterium]|nr:Rne/Rng family ribonuclease [Bacteriovoracaceae bacterium]
MAKELVVNQTHNESRIALIENGEILDFLIERHVEHESHPVVGNIYLGKVLRVLPGMQSAFVDIGQERAAFLYVDDAYLPTLDEQREILSRSSENADQKRLGEVIPDEFSTLTETVDMKFRPDVKIQDFLKEGDEIVVQIAKEPISTKGPRVTRHITLAGRHMVYMPFIEHTGVSRRIESEEERRRLKDILDSIRPEGVGVIARTVSEGQSYKVLKGDYNNLVKIWKDIQKKLEKAKAPFELHQDLSFIQRALRDIMDEDVDALIADSKSAIKQIEKFVQRFTPQHKAKIKLYDGELPIFEHYGIDIEIERALSNQVFLRSGGSINIDQTEALVSIDVNTGKFVGKKTLEETILKTNLEAVKEIAYQLRVRNCGGIIIIDFIDMEKEDHRNQVYSALLEALKKDRSKTNVLPISGLGLVEMTRKRTRDTLTRTMCEPCPYCEGVGRVKSIETVSYEVIRELQKVLKRTSASKITIFAHPEVCAKLSGEFGIIDTLEEAFNKTILVRADNNYHSEQYELYAPEGP